MADPITLPQCLTKHLHSVADVELIREAAEVIADAMERLHRAPFQVCVDHECGFVFVNRDRNGGANG